MEKWPLPFKNLKNATFWTKLPLKKRETFEIRKSRKEEKENEPRVLSWMVDYNTLYGLLIYIYIVDLRIVIDYLCKRILKGYSFDWSVNFFFSSFWKNAGMEENETKWKKTEKDLEKYVYYFEIVCFFGFSLCWFHTFAWGVCFLSAWF